MLRRTFLVARSSPSLPRVCGMFRPPNLPLLLLLLLLLMMMMMMMIIMMLMTRVLVAVVPITVVLKKFFGASHLNIVRLMTPK